MWRRVGRGMELSLLNLWMGRRSWSLMGRLREKMKMAEDLVMSIRYEMAHQHNSIHKSNQEKDSHDLINILN